MSDPQDPLEAGLLAKYKGTPRVSMSNALVKAKHDLSLHEKRLVALCVSKLDSGRHWTPESLTIRVTAVEYQAVFGLTHNKHVYRDLKNATESLWERSIVFQTQGKKGAITDTLRWVHHARYYAGDGWVELSFSPSLAPHLFKLRKHFTTYHLQQASGLRSVYAWRLLELLMQFPESKRLMIRLQDLHHAMEVPPSTQKSFKDLRRRVLEPAIKELRAKEDLEIDITPRKSGRKITSLVFTFGYPQQQALGLEDTT